MTDIIKKRIAVIGGGPAGIMAAFSAGLNNKCIINLYERNEKLGKKLYITGKGRCNLTNACDSEDFFKSVIRNKKFFYSAFYTFDNNSLIALIERFGTKLKVERGNRIFPASDKSSDILRALNKMLINENIHIELNTKINKIRKIANGFLLNDIKQIYDAVILAGGGMSYPATGSDGNIYDLALGLGHSITKLESGLCGIETTDIDIHKLSGISLRNVEFIIKHGKKTKYKNLGEMEFTHFGISGPLVLSASSLFGVKDFKNLDFLIDLKPGLDYNKLENRIKRDIKDEPNKSIKNTLGKLLPLKLMGTIFLRSAVDWDKKGNQLTKTERCAIINNIKLFTVSPIRLRPIAESIITKGGIDCSEINPLTLESRIVENLYFAGEMIDIDALTGGYNLQIAFSTGYSAGLNSSGIGV